MQCMTKPQPRRWSGALACTTLAPGGNQLCLCLSPIKVLERQACRAGLLSRAGVQTAAAGRVLDPPPRPVLLSTMRQRG